MTLIESIGLPFRESFRNRAILITTTYNEVRSIYAGSILGTTWLLLGALLMLGVYSLTYAVIFRIRPPDMTTSEYILYVFCGLTPFLGFSNALSLGTMSLVSNRAVLMNTVFPAELIPLRAVMVGSIGMPVNMLILFVGDVAFSTPSWTFLLVPFVLLLQVMFVAGICWMLSLAALLLRDIQYMIYYFIMLLMIVTPIAYTASMIPPQLGAIIYFNPLAYFVMSVQSLVILNELPPLSIVVPMVIISLTTFVVGFRVCRNAKSAFYDYA